MGGATKEPHPPDSSTHCPFAIMSASAFFSVLHGLCYHLPNGAVMTEGLIDVRIFPKFRGALSMEWLTGVAECGAGGRLAARGCRFRPPQHELGHRR